MYFQDSYVGLKDGDKGIKSCYVQKILDVIGDGDDKGFIGKVGHKVVALAFNSPNIEVIVPESTFVNTSYQAVYCSRRTERNQKKGVRDRQFRIEQINRGDFDQEFIPERVRMSQCINGLFEKDFPTFKESVAKLDAGEMMSCAFHSHFCVAINAQAENIILYYKGLICGYVGAGSRITLDDQFIGLQEKLIEILEHNDD